MISPVISMRPELAKLFTIIDLPLPDEEALDPDTLETRTGLLLQEMFDLHPPRLWVFGHYHVDRRLELGGTLFRCLAPLGTADVEDLLDG